MRREVRLRPQPPQKCPHSRERESGEGRPALPSRPRRASPRKPTGGPVNKGVGFPHPRPFSRKGEGRWAYGFVHPQSCRVRASACAQRLFAARGGASIETLAKLAKADAMPALAITDANNLFGALEFSEKLAKSGVQPIIGAADTVDFGDAAPAFWRGVERDNARAPIVLLAQNEAGYRNLLRLVSALWLDPNGRRRSAYPVRGAERERRPHRADRRPRRADRPRAQSGIGRSRRAPARAARRDVRREALCRDPAPRARSGARDRASAHRSRRSLRACRWSRPTSPISPTLRLRSA